MKVIIEHEEGHAFRLDQDLVKEKPKTDIFNDSYFEELTNYFNELSITEEVETSKIENIIRNEINKNKGRTIKQRTKYSNI